jgi:hypothetical protein
VLWRGDGEDRGAGGQKHEIDHSLFNPT